MMKTLVQVSGTLLLAIGVLGGLFVIGMRARFQPLQKAVRKLNRSFVNPRSMETAGQPGAYASIIRHQGRNSNRDYETPIGVLPAGEGFVVALPYGTSPDWLKNVMASGSAELVTEGATYRVDNPEIVAGVSVAEVIPKKDRRTNRIYGIDQFLVLHQSPISDRP